MEGGSPEHLERGAHLVGGFRDFPCSLPNRSLPLSHFDCSKIAPLKPVIRELDWDLQWQGMKKRNI